MSASTARPTRLFWSGSPPEDWLFVTLDTNTAVGYAYERAAAGLVVAPVAVVNTSRPFGEVAEDLQMISMCESL